MKPASCSQPGPGAMGLAACTEGVTSEIARDLLLEALPLAQDALSRAVPDFKALWVGNGFRALKGLVIV